MPLLGSRSSSVLELSHSSNVLPQLENYCITDDNDGITSSDEESNFDTNSFSLRSWVGRPRKRDESLPNNNLILKESASRPATSSSGPPLSSSSSASKRSLHSFFKKHNRTETEPEQLRQKKLDHLIFQLNQDTLFEAKAKGNAKEKIEPLDSPTKLEAIFSPPVDKGHTSSPLTPTNVDPASSPYRLVFKPLKEYADETMGFDFCTFDINSSSYQNIEAAVKMLVPDENDSNCNKELTLLQKTKEVLNNISRHNENKQVTLQEYTELQKNVDNSKEEISKRRDKYNTLLNSNEKLNQELKTLNKKSTRLENHIDEEKKKNGMLQDELNDASCLMKTLKLKISEEEEKHTTVIQELLQKINSETAKLHATQEQNNTLAKLQDSLENEHRDLNMNFQILKEKNDLVTSRLIDLVGARNKFETEEREMRNKVEFIKNKAGMLESNTDLLKLGNLKVQEHYQKERRKVLDMRREKAQRIVQVCLNDFYRTQSLEFMQHLSHVYEHLVTPDISSRYNLGLQKLSQFEFEQIGTMPKDDIKINQMKEDITEFYRQIAKKVFLESIISKHVSHTRSTNFLSEQLKRLRNDIAEEKLHIKELTKEINGRKAYESIKG